MRRDTVATVRKNLRRTFPLQRPMKNYSLPHLSMRHIDTAKVSTPLTSITLQQVKLAARAFLDGHALESMELSVWPDEFANGIVMQLRTLVLGEKVHETTETVTFQYPANAWEHLKSHLPMWLRNWLPTQKFQTATRTVKFEQVQCLPKIRQVLPRNEREFEFSTFHMHEDGDYPFDSDQ